MVHKEVCDNPTVIIPPGRPRLVHLDTAKKLLLIQTPTAKFLSVDRHYNPDTRRTEHCKCDPHCPSHRVDSFCSVLEWVGPCTYEQRIWPIPEGTLAYLFRIAILERRTKELQGLRLMAARQGAHDNARIVVEPIGEVRIKSPGFDLGAAVLRITGIATDFFHQVATEPEVLNDDQIVTPIRARVAEALRVPAKPRIDKGKRP